MVEDVEAAIRKAGKLAGNVMAPPAQAGEIGRFAVVQDPQGGVFTVMQFSGPVDPPLGAEAENWSLEIGNPTSDF